MSIKQAARDSFAKYKQSLEAIRKDNFARLIRLVNELPGEARVEEYNHPVLALEVNGCEYTVAIYDGLAFGLIYEEALVKATRIMNVADITHSLKVAVFCVFGRQASWVVIKNLAQLGELVEYQLDSLSNFRYSKVHQVRVVTFDTFMTQPQVPEPPEDG